MTDNRPILVIDNYDSFVYNLVQYVGEVDGNVTVARNDAITLDDIDSIDPAGIIVSPGPGTPDQAGVSVPLFEHRQYPTLGVCLGHQALCSANGAAVVHAPDVVHGKPSVISHDGQGIFERLPDRFRVGRYHSLAVRRDDLPAGLIETAHTADEQDVLMAVRHRSRPHIGVQFHPESILTRTVDEGTIGLDDDDQGTAESGSISLELGKRLIHRFCSFARSIDP